MRISDLIQVIRSKGESRIKKVVVTFRFMGFLRVMSIF